MAKANKVFLINTDEDRIPITNENEDRIRIASKQLVLKLLIGIRKIEGRTIDQVKERSGLAKSTIMKLESNSIPITTVSLEKYSRGINIKYSTVVQYLEKLEQEYIESGIEPQETINRDVLLRFLLLASGSSDNPDL